MALKEMTTFLNVFSEKRMTQILITKHIKRNIIQPEYKLVCFG